MFNINKKMKFVFFVGLFTLFSVNLSAKPAKADSGFQFEDISSVIDFNHDSSPDILVPIVVDQSKPMNALVPPSHPDYNPPVDSSNVYGIVDHDDDGIIDAGANVNEGLRYDSGTGFGGIAWIDYDQDGDQDIYLVNGIDLPAGLFRNNGDLTFTDVTAAAGLTDLKGASGALAADLNNDGYPEIITAGDGGLFGGPHSANALYKNNGDGTFTHIVGSDPTLPTLNAKAADPAMAAEDRDIYSTSASISVADLDNDGDLDVFIGAHGIFAAGFDQYEMARPQREHRLYRNDGNFEFVEITGSAGLLVADLTQGDGVGNAGACTNSFSDYDRDGDQDLFISNCNVAQRLPLIMMGMTSEGPIQLLENISNDIDGIKFEDVTKKVGLGDIGGWMGMAFLDYDKDGNMDVFVSNTGRSFDPSNPVGQNGGFAIGPHSLFRNNGDGSFSDVSIESNMEVEGFSWGSTARDYDNDGYVDIQFNGGLSVIGYNLDMMHMPDLDPGTPGDQGPDLIAPMMIMRAAGDGTGGSGYVQLNNGDGTFRDASDEAGVVFLRDLSTSGSASGDLDNDGFPDLIVQTNPNKTNLGLPLPLFFASLPYLACPVLYPNPAPAGCVREPAGQPGGLHPMWFAPIFPGPMGPVNGQGYLAHVPASGLPLPPQAETFYRAINFFDGALSLLGGMGVPSLVHPDDVVGDGHIVVLRNKGNDNNWIGFDLQGTVSNRDAVGARLSVGVANPETGGYNLNIREVIVGASYLSNNDKRFVVGLGSARTVTGVDVEWPSGCKEKFQHDRTINEYHTLIEGDGHGQVNCK